jgi:hypothetical protein
MALNFPSNPVTNTEYTFGTKTWVYNGFAWDLKTNATNLLEALKTVDGIDSGLDADLLDGNSSDYYTDIAARLGYTPANTSTVSAALDAKADTSTVNAALDEKADSSTVNDALSLKQDNLVSGTNIKTVNGESVLGSGDIVISSGASSSISSSATGHTLSTAESLAYGYYGLRLSNSSSSGVEVPIKITSATTNPSIILGNNSDGSWAYNGYSNNIAIGNNIYSGENSIVIGSNSSAGSFFGTTYNQVVIGSYSTAQGNNNVAIGTNANALDSGNVGTVVINGSQSAQVFGDGGFYVNPIRDNTNFQTSGGTLQYDTMSKEIFYAPGSGGSGGPSKGSLVTSSDTDADGLLLPDSVYTKASFDPQVWQKYEDTFDATQWESAGTYGGTIHNIRFSPALALSPNNPDTFATDGGNIAIHLGSNGVVMITRDGGFTWVPLKHDFSAGVAKVYYFPGQGWVLIGGGLIAKSSDTYTWSERVGLSDDYGGFAGIAYGNGVFLIAANRFVYTSYDLVTFTRNESFQQAAWTLISFKEGKFYLVSQTVPIVNLSIETYNAANLRYLVTTTDGNNFQFAAGNLFSGISDIAVSGSNIVVTNGSAVSSSINGGTSFTTRTPTGSFTRVMYVNGTFLLPQRGTAGTATLFHSVDGVIWTTVSLPNINALYADYSPITGQYYIVSGGGVVAYSSNLLSWTTKILPDAANLVGILTLSTGIVIGIGVVNTYYIDGTVFGDICTSGPVATTTISYSRGSSPTNTDAMATDGFGNIIFAFTPAAGSNGRYLTGVAGSNNYGNTWRSLARLPGTLIANTTPSSVFYIEGLWVITFSTNTGFVYSNTSNPQVESDWIHAAGLRTANVKSIVKYTMGGVPTFFATTSAGVWYATDINAATWTQITGSTGNFLNTIASNGSIVVTSATANQSFSRTNASGNAAAWTTITGLNSLLTSNGGTVTNIRYISNRGRFYVTTSLGNIFTSVDGTTWVNMPGSGAGIVSSASINTVLESNNLVLFLQSNGGVCVSHNTTPTDFIRTATGHTDSLISGYYDDLEGRAVVLSSTAGLFSSIDGFKWQRLGGATGVSSPQGVLKTGYSTVFAYGLLNSNSTDGGKTWTRVGPNNIARAQFISRIIKTGNYLFGLSGSLADAILRSTDGITWEELRLNCGGSPKIFYIDFTWYVVTNIYGVIRVFTSYDGLNSINLTSTLFTESNRQAFSSSNIFIGAAESSNMFYSSALVLVVSRNTSNPRGFEADIYISYDGSSWVKRNLPKGYTFPTTGGAVALAGNTLLVSGLPITGSGGIMTFISTDLGTTWKRLDTTNSSLWSNLDKDYLYDRTTGILIDASDGKIISMSTLSTAASTRIAWTKNGDFYYGIAEQFLFMYKKGWTNVVQYNPTYTNVNAYPYSLGNANDNMQNMCIKDGYIYASNWHYLNVSFNGQFEPGSILRSPLRSYDANDYFYVPPIKAPGGTGIGLKYL